MSSLTASLITSVQIIRIPVLWYLSDKSGLKLNTNVQTWGLLERHAELSYLEVESTLISCVPSIFKSLFFSCMSENLWNQEILNNWPFNKFWNSMPGAVHAFVSKLVASQISACWSALPFDLIKLNRFFIFPKKTDRDWVSS